MDPLAIALLALRIAAGLISPKASQAVNLLVDSIEAGKNVDAHMAEVAAALKAGTQPDWDGLVARIEADSADLHRDAPGV